MASLARNASVALLLLAAAGSGALASDRDGRREEKRDACIDRCFEREYDCLDRVVTRYERCVEKSEGKPLPLECDCALLPDPDCGNACNRLETCLESRDDGEDRCLDRQARCLERCED